MLPITLEEAKAALIRAQQTCRGIVLRPNLARAAASVRFNGLVAGFIEQARAGGVRDPQRYFDEIIDNLLALCRNRGVELHRTLRGR
ncbi:MAG: hypothetical protein KY469_15860 [Actinobacteria bacterium]|nr:hypothetical protein [Actinomycetota bacterium]